MFEILENFFLQQTTYQVAVQITAIIGWIGIAWVFLWAGLYSARVYKWFRFTSTFNWVLLAIDVPPENVQTPKAVEQLFSHIYSVMDPPSLATYYHRGFQQYYFSFEIISIGGYIQFLIRTLDKYRDVVEAAVYAQYPDAEITEVEDYIDSVPSHYPNDTHKMWAADYILTNHWAYPIRMYGEFEHSISKDTVLKDPMGTFLESFTRIGPGEQLWWQMIIEPIQEKRWKNKVVEEVKKIIGEKSSKSPGALSDVSELSKGMFGEVRDQIFGRGEGEAGGASKKDEPINKMLYLTPGQRELVEMMEKKMSKLGFKTKIRVIYVAEKDAYRPARAINSITGAINQYTIPSSNALLPKYLTSVEFMFAKMRANYRRNILMSAYKSRDIAMGKEPYILNIEELATIWHFPMSHVKTPLVQKAAIKTAEPPVGLPMEGPGGVPPSLGGVIVEEGEKTEAEKKRTYQTDSGEVGIEDEMEFG